MKKWLCLVLMTCLLFVMCGCTRLSGKEGEDTVTNIVVQKDGSIIHTIYEDFGESYYTIDGLSEMIDQTIRAYVKENPGASITLDQCELLDGQVVKVKMTYNDCDAYSGFNANQLFVGTIQQAYERGLNLDLYLSSVAQKDKSTITKQELLNMAENYILITEETMEITVNSDILFASDSAEVLGKKKVMMKQEQGTSAIVFK